MFLAQRITKSRRSADSHHSSHRWPNASLTRRPHSIGAPPAITPPRWLNAKCMSADLSLDPHCSLEIYCAVSPTLLGRRRVALPVKPRSMGLCCSTPSRPPPTSYTYPNDPNAGYYNYAHAPFPSLSIPSNTYYPPSSGPIATFSPTSNQERRRLAKRNAQIAQDRRREGKNELSKSRAAQGPYYLPRIVTRGKQESTA